MSWHLEMTEHASFPILETHYVGVLSPSQLSAAVHATIDGARAMTRPLLLGNCTALAGGHSPFDLYADMLLSAGLAGTFKEAVLLPALPGPIEDVRFWETTCLNRGINVRVFTERDAAVAWLVST